MEAESILTSSPWFTCRDAEQRWQVYAKDGLLIQFVKDFDESPEMAEFVELLLTAPEALFLRKKLLKNVELLHLGLDTVPLTEEEETLILNQVKLYRTYFSAEVMNGSAVIFANFSVEEKDEDVHKRVRHFIKTGRAIAKPSYAPFALARVESRKVARLLANLPQIWDSIGAILDRIEMLRKWNSSKRRPVVKKPTPVLTPTEEEFFGIRASGAPFEELFLAGPILGC